MSKRSAEDLLNLPPSKRRKTKIGTPKQDRKQRPEFTRDELIDYLRSHDFRTAQSLAVGREEKDPVVYDYRREFGTWQKAKEAIFGKQPERAKPEDAEYLAKVVLEFEIHSRDQWIRAHHKRPEIVPSIYHVRKHWGTFTNLKAFVYKVYSCQLVLREYIALRRRLRRWPTLEDCAAEGLILEKPLKLFDGKRKMDAYLKMVLKKGFEI